MVALKFSECFWTAEFTSTTGFDILVKKMKDGRMSSKELESFIKDRSKIEEDYAKALLRLSRASLGSTESCTLLEAFSAVKTDMERISSVHLDMSQGLTEQASRIHAMRDKSGSMCKQAEEMVKKLQALKKDLYNKCQSSQQNYQKKSAAYDLAHQQYVAETNQAVQRPLREKLENKAGKCKEDKLKVEDTYQSFVKQLESVRESWELEMEKACETFQLVEHERIGYFRNELWIHVNLDSKTLYDHDEFNEEARAAMEKCDPQTDVQEFIQTHQTGSGRPAPIVYESADTKPVAKTLNRPSAPMRPPAVGAASSGSTFFRVDSQSAPVDDPPDDPLYSSIM